MASVVRIRHPGQQEIKVGIQCREYCSPAPFQRSDNSRDRPLRRFAQFLKRGRPAEHSVNLGRGRGWHRGFPHPCANDNGYAGANRGDALYQLCPAHLRCGPVRDRGVESDGSGTECRQRVDSNAACGSPVTELSEPQFSQAEDCADASACRCRRRAWRLLCPIPRRSGISHAKGH